jgi:hypothetical protein
LSITMSYLYKIIFNGHFNITVMKSIVIIASLFLCVFFSECADNSVYPSRNVLIVDITKDSVIKGDLTVTVYGSWDPEVFIDAKQNIPNGYEFSFLLTDSGSGNVQLVLDNGTQKWYSINNINVNASRSAFSESVTILFDNIPLTNYGKTDTITASGNVYYKK